MSVCDEQYEPGRRSATHTCQHPKGHEGWHFCPICGAKWRPGGVHDPHAATPENTDLWAHLREQHHTITEGLTEADLDHWQIRHDTKLHRPTAHVPVPHSHECTDGGDRG